MPESNAPVTREELRQELAIIEARILNAVREANEAQEARFLSAVRQTNEDLETRLLTAFHSYARGVEAKIRVSQTIGLAGVERLDALEARVLDIEEKLLQR